jgi:hypothetical protein
MVYALLRQGDLPCIHIGRSVRVDPTDFRNYLRRHRLGRQT